MALVFRRRPFQCGLVEVESGEESVFVISPKNAAAREMVEGLGFRV